MCDASGDGMLALPIEFYGLDYVIATYKLMNTGQFLILTDGVNVRVNITFPNDFIYNNVTYSRQKPLIVTIRSSSGFYIKADEDLTGTIITASQPIMVISGTSCISGSPSDENQCANMVEQLLPSPLLGKSYILSTLANAKLGDLYRVVAAYNNTNVQIQHHSKNYTLLQGTFYEFGISNDSMTYVACDKPCLVVQYTYGVSDNDINDKLVMVMPPAIENYDFLNVITIPERLADEKYLTSNAILITVPDKHKSDLTLNGKLLDDVDWKYFNAVNNVTYAIATINMDIGINIISHDHYIPYGLIQHGSGKFGSSYGLIGNIKVPKVTKCKYVRLSFNITFNEQCSR